MVLKFRLISNEQDEFIRDFEILDEQTFFHFHTAIQDNLHFDRSQIASFYICNENWEKEQEITLFEFSDENNNGILVMDNSVIKDHMSEVHDKMQYVFDVFNERLLYIELVGITTQQTGKEYPQCVHKKGPAPQQILMDPINGSGKELTEDMSFVDDFPGEELHGRDEPDKMGYFSLDDNYVDED